MIGPRSLAALPGAIGNRCFPDAPLREVVRQSAVSFGTRVAGLAVAFLASVLLARVLGASEFGAYAIALGWASVLAIPARLGLDNVALRFVTIYREGRNPGLLRGFLRASAFSIAAASAILGALVVAAGFVVGPGHADPALVVAVALLIPAMAALGWLSAVIRSFQRIFASQAYEQLFRPTILIVLLGAAWASGLSLDAPKAMWMTVVAIALPLALLAHHVRREAAALGPAQADGSDRRMWMAVGWPLLLLSIFQEAGNQIDLILIGILNDSTSAAHFAAAMRLASLASLGLVAIVTVSGPMIASAFHRKDDATLARLATVTARISLLFAVVLVTGLLIFGRVALGAFGPSFPAAYPALAVLCLGALVNAFTGSVGYFLLMTGYERTAAAILAAALAIAAAVDIALIPSLGAIGAAIGSVAGLASWNLAMLVFVRRRLGIDCSPLGLHVRGRIVAMQEKQSDARSSISASIE